MAVNREEEYYNLSYIEKIKALSGYRGYLIKAVDKRQLIYHGSKRQNVIAIQIQGHRWSNRYN